ncbi:hypothetical protein J4421_02760 [Candidatus Woesearchaeota archaeon]|nr:hypothetical protein [Candidatus Woesearchaeota archaeon]
MFPKEVLYGIYISLAILITGALFLMEPLSSPTGDVIYQELSSEVSVKKIWYFENASEYIYNSSAISINGTVQLKLLTTTNTSIIEEINESFLVSATEYEDDDDEAENRTSKVNTVGNGHVQLKDGEVVLEVKVDLQFKNSDILSVYLLSGTTGSGRIYLCKSKSGCNMSEYGALTLPSSVSNAWYNLTLSGISSSNDTFFIDSPNKIKIDMVKGYKKKFRTEIFTTFSYPSSASIETKDFQPTDWKSWRNFSKVEQLHGQQVQYEYSTASGGSWTTVPANNSLGSVTENTTRFRVTLFSNTTETPFVDSIEIMYTTQLPCTENWTVQYESCLVNDSRLRLYYDMNECGSKITLPADNGTSIACDYCLPQWNEVNSSCGKDDLIRATFRDVKTCYALTNLTSDNNSPAGRNHSCSYCTLFNCSQSTIKEPITEVGNNKTIHTFDAVAEANTKLEIEAPFQAPVEIIEYSRNIKNETPSSTPLNRYINIESNLTNVSSVKIFLYYNDNEIVALDENTLKIYYYNETSRQWDALPSTVNKSGNYVYAVVPHLSLYGLFGEVQSSSSVSSVSTSGEEGGGSSRHRSDAVTTVSNSLNSETEETVLPTQSEPETTVRLDALVSEASCDYVVEISLPNLITFGNNDFYEGEIVNKGNCEIPSLNVELSPELQEKVSVPVFYFEHLHPGNKTNFVLIRTQQNQNNFFEATSYVVSNFRQEKISGLMIVEGKDEQELVFRRELPLEVIFAPSAPWKEITTIALALAILFCVILVSIRVRRRKKTVRQKKVPTSKGKHL